MSTAEQSYPYWPVQQAGQIGVQTNILPGTMMLWPTATPPAGWLICNGQAVSRTLNAALYTAIGTTYGNGDGSSTFNLPSLNDRFPIGVGTNALAATGGSATVTLSVGNLPSHTHTVDDPGHSHTDSGHSHTFTAVLGRTFNGIGGGTQWDANQESQGTTGSGSANINPASTGIQVGYTGNSTPFSVLNPFLALNFIIKT